MKRHTLKILTCCKCGESDYGEYMNRIDGRVYCQTCAEEIEAQLIDRVFTEVDGNGGIKNVQQ